MSYFFKIAQKRNNEIEAKCARPVQDGVQTVKSHGIQNGYFFVYTTRIVNVLLRRTPILLVVIRVLLGSLLLRTKYRLYRTVKATNYLLVWPHTLVFFRILISCVTSLHSLLTFRENGNSISIHVFFTRFAKTWL